MKYQFTPRRSSLKEKFVVFVAFLRKLTIVEIVEIVKKTLFYRNQKRGEMNHEFLITTIPGITIISSSVSCCSAEVCPRRKCKKSFITLQLNLKEVQRREQIWRPGKRGTGLCLQQGQHELSAPHVLKIIEHILSVHCFLLLILRLFQILSHFHRSVFNEF